MTSQETTGNNQSSNHFIIVILIVMNAGLITLILFFPEVLGLMRITPNSSTNLSVLAIDEAPTSEPAPTSIPIAYDELLVNGDFEEAFEQTAPSWGMTIWGTGVATASPAQSTDGQVQQVVVTSLPDSEDAGGVYFRHVIGLEKTHVYRFTVSLRSPDGAIVRVQLRQDSPDWVVGAAKTVQLTDAWQEVTIEGGLYLDIEGSVGINMLSTGTVEIDKASLFDITMEAIHNHYLAGTIEETFFGMHFNKPEPLSRNSDLPELGYGAVRLWDNVITWADIEPIKNQWDFSRFDSIVGDLSPNTEDFIYTLGMAPQWARKNPDDIGSVPGNIEHWRNYVRTVGKRYRGRILYYEIWNESNVSRFSSITPREMVELTQIAREELLAIDPNIKILSPNIDGLGLPFLDKFLFYGGGEFIDIISYHNYADVLYPEDSIGSHIGVLNLRDNYGLSHLPIWNTEGALVLESDNTSNDKLDRAMTARNYLLHRLAGIERFYWYTWDIYEYEDTQLLHLSTDDFFGLRAGGVAYHELSNWIVGREIVDVEIKDLNGLWHISLQDSDGRISHLLFHYDSEATYTIPDSWENPIVNHLDGSNLTVSPTDNIRIGIEPVLITTRNQQQ